MKTAQWKVMFDPRVERDLVKIGTVPAARILDYLEKRVSEDQNPRQRAKPLSGKYKALWSYRVGNYRIICRFDEGAMVVLVLEIGHRGGIYK